MSLQNQSAAALIAACSSFGAVPSRGPTSQHTPNQASSAVSLLSMIVPSRSMSIPRGNESVTETSLLVFLSAGPSERVQIMAERDQTVAIAGTAFWRSGQNLRSVHTCVWVRQYQDRGLSGSWYVEY